MAHFGSPDDYDYDDFNDEYLPWRLIYLGDYYAYLSDLRLSIG
jgi:hypothetical protein